MEFAVKIKPIVDNMLVVVSAVMLVRFRSYPSPPTCPFMRISYDPHFFFFLMFVFIHVFHDLYLIAFFVLKRNKLWFCVCFAHN